MQPRSLQYDSTHNENDFNKTDGEDLDMDDNSVPSDSDTSVTSFHNHSGSSSIGDLSPPYDESDGGITSNQDALASDPLCSEESDCGQLDPENDYELDDFLDLAESTEPYLSDSEPRSNPDNQATISSGMQAFQAII